MSESIPLDTIPDIRAALAATATAVSAFFASLTPEQLTTRRADEWAPLDDLAHLRLSVQPVVRALMAPKVVIALRFGVARRPSLPYSALAARYRARLEGGVRAPPQFVPRPRHDLTPEAYRDHLLTRWAELGDRLWRALERWNERSIDRYQLLHPALGKLTVREILYFTHLHNLHHIEVAERRLRRAAGT